MNRILIKKEGGIDSVLNLVILNFIKSNFSEKEKERKKKERAKSFADEFSIPGDRDLAFAQLEEEGYIRIDSEDCVYLTKQGREYFEDETTILEEAHFHVAEDVLSIWNGSRHTSHHTVKPYRGADGNINRQTKLVQTVVEAVGCLLTGNHGKLFKGVKTRSGVVLDFPKLTSEEILIATNAYLLQFEPEYFPDRKEVLPKNITDFICTYKSTFSSLIDSYMHAPKKKTVETIESLSVYGVTVPTLRLAYNTLLDSDSKTKEIEKLRVQKQIVILHKQWVDLKATLDVYYLWKPEYRLMFSDFNTFLNTYIAWMSREIAGGCFPAYLQLKEGHLVYESYKAYFMDKYGIRFKVLRRTRQDLMRKTSEYKEKLKGEKYE